MRTIDIVKRAGRSLREAKARTLLTSLAIGVGAFTVTLALAAGEGSRQYADRLISSNVDPQLLVVAKDDSLFGEGGSIGEQSGITEYSETQASLGAASYEQLTDEDIEKIRTIEGVGSIEPVAQVTPKYVEFESNDKKYVADVLMYGTGLIVESAAGTLPSSGETLGDWDIIIPESYLETIGVAKPSDIVGRKVTITVERAAAGLSEADVQAAFQEGGAEAVAKLSATETKEYSFTVSAVAKSSSMAITSSLETLQISPTAAKQIFDYTTEGTDYAGRYIMAAGMAADGADPADVKQRLEDAGYPTQTAEDFQEMLFIIVNLLQGIVIGFGILALIASVFGIINTQYISVLERTQQIGLMKALGTRGRDVARLFRYEAAWIGLLGGLIGSAIAIALGLSMNPWITETLQLGEGNYLLIFEWYSVVALIIGLMLIAVVAGYFPARKAAKLDPIEALRTE